MALNPKYSTLSVGQIEDLYRNNELELSPQFQRSSVWNARDRAKLIESVLLGMPIPAIFLYRNENTNASRGRFEVIDGKQRIETLLAFLGAITGPGDDGRRVKVLRRAEDQTRVVVELDDLRPAEARRLRSYKIPVVTVEPDSGIAEVVDLFVRLNSTGKRLTGMERRKAQHFESSMLNKAQNAAVEFIPRFESLGVLSKVDIQRMRHIELTLELVLSVYQGGPLDKKRALDSVLTAGAIQAESLNGSIAAVRKALGYLSRIWRSSTRNADSVAFTRFTRLSDFYSLTLFLALRTREGWELRADNARVVADLLLGFDQQLAEVAEAQKRFRKAPDGSVKAVQYLSTVKEGTDRARNRKARMKILEELLGDDVLLPLDISRTFSKDQRRILWYASNRRCECCDIELTFQQVQIDHIVPYIKGGKTEVANGQILCGPCNATKGAGRRCFH